MVVLLASTAAAWELLIIRYAYVCRRVRMLGVGGDVRSELGYKANDDTPSGVIHGRPRIGVKVVMSVARGSINNVDYKGT